MRKSPPELPAVFAAPSPLLDLPTIVSPGQVWSWGDGDYGKLGRGGSDGCKTPKLVEKLQDLDIVKVCCGSQFSVALTKDGQVYTWGKGDNQRLGHGTDEHVRFPKLLDTLQGESMGFAVYGQLQELDENCISSPVDNIHQRTFVDLHPSISTHFKLTNGTNSFHCCNHHVPDWPRDSLKDRKLSED